MTIVLYDKNGNLVKEISGVSYIPTGNFYHHEKCYKLEKIIDELKDDGSYNTEIKCKEILVKP
jgi:thioredoxin-related protein